MKDVDDTSYGRFMNSKPYFLFFAFVIMPINVYLMLTKSPWDGIILTLMQVPWFTMRILKFKRDSFKSEITNDLMMEEG